MAPRRGQPRRAPSQRGGSALESRPVPIPIEEAARTTLWPRGLRPGSPAEAGLDPQRLEAAFALLAEEIGTGRLPGAVAAVVRRGVVVALRSMGWAQLYPERRVMAPDTLFDLASLTKVMATLPAVLVLLERGALRLDDPVSLYLPEFAGEGREEVRLRHLLTHTAGLPAGVPLWQDPGDRASRIRRACQAPLLAPPGTRVIYSDVGFILLGEVVERVAGRPLDRFVQDHVLQPLGLREARFNPPPAVRPRCAATEYREALGRYLCGEVHDENAAALDGVAGHAGLFATAAEVAAYGQMWLAGGSLGGVQILSPAAVAAATRDQTPGLQEARGWGWLVVRPGSEGLSCGDLFSPGSFGHTGFTGTSLWVDPARELVVVLLTNRVHLGRTDHILRLRPRFHNAVAAAVR